MKKVIVTIMGLVLTMSLCACGTAPEPTLSNPNGENLIEETFVEEIFIEEISVEEIKIKGIME